MGKNHAPDQSFCNKDASHILDATLTELGKAQCLRLKNESTMHNVTSVVMSSPHRRAIQTAVLAFGPTLSRPEVPFEIVPNAQEVSGLTCNIGYPRDELEQEIFKLFSNQDVRFDLQKLDYSQVETGWNSKVSTETYQSSVETHLLKFILSSRRVSGPPRVKP